MLTAPIVKQVNASARLANRNDQFRLQQGCLSDAQYAGLKKAIPSTADPKLVEAWNQFAAFGLRSMNAHQQDTFLQILARAPDKIMQLAHALPPFNKPDDAFLCLTAGCSFASVEWIALARLLDLQDIRALLMFKDHQLESAIEKTRDWSQLRALMTFYLCRFSPSCNTLWQKLLAALDQPVFAGQHLQALDATALKIIFQAARLLDEDAALDFETTLIEANQRVGAKLQVFLSRIDLPDQRKLAQLSELLAQLVGHGHDADFSFLSEATVDRACRRLEDKRKAVPDPTRHALPADLAQRLTNDADVVEPLQDDAIVWVSEKYGLVCHYEQKYSAQTLAALLPRVAELKSKLDRHNDLVSGIEKDAALCELLAIAKRIIALHFRIHPYPIQILTALAMLSPHAVGSKGHLAQVKTGEGKSMILALVALAHACQGKCVDVVTSSSKLAQRDQHKYASFFQWFGVTSSALAGEQLTQQEFSGQIVYGEIAQFEFAILFDALYDTQYRTLYSDPVQCRRFDVVLVDEIDNFLFNAAMHSARIAHPTTDRYTALYPKIADYVRLHGRPDQKPDDKMVQACLALAGEFAVDPVKIKILVANAYDAFFVHQPDVHYRIQRTNALLHGNGQDSQIVIVDKHTGRKQQGSRWQHGLHAFLELKHKLPVHPDSSTVGFLSHHAFFSYFPEIYGVTGTMGSNTERGEIRDVYRLNTFDMPPHRPRQLQRAHTLIAGSQVEFQNLMLAEIMRIRESGRPCLIIHDSIVRSQNVANMLQTQLGHDNIQLLNDVQEEAEDNVINLAGKASFITSATNAAGRGTDILLTEQAVANGGLHVIFTFFPSDDRVEAQGAGRAARQGQPGSYTIILPHDDAALIQARGVLSGLGIKTGQQTVNTILNTLTALRTAQVENQSQQRRKIARLSQVQHQLWHKFLDWYKSQLTNSGKPRQILLDKWAQLLDDLEMHQSALEADDEQFSVQLAQYEQLAVDRMKEFN